MIEPLKPLTAQDNYIDFVLEAKSAGAYEVSTNIAPQFSLFRATELVVREYISHPNEPADEYTTELEGAYVDGNSQLSYVIPSETFAPNSMMNGICWPTAKREIKFVVRFTEPRVWTARLYGKGIV